MNCSTFFLSFLVFFLLKNQLISAQNAQNKITNLPGLNTALNFSMYADYITVGSHNYFYWFVESAQNPSTDPILLWLNGGPGCSSFGGLLSENGPFSPDQNGNLVINPYSWNLLSNVLYLESPAGVGFSYCNDNCRFDDNSTASDNYQFLSKWFSTYPSYAKNDFYIAGESYAGHYIPQLVQYIHDNTKSNPNQAPQSNFKGFAAGNPLSDQYYDLEGPYLAQYMQTHGMTQLDTTSTHASGNFNPYDILVDVCSADHVAQYIRFPHPFNNMKGIQPGEKSPFTKREVPNPTPCIDDYVSEYLNTPAVQKAIHARSTHWKQCGGPPYHFGTMSMIPIYQNFIQNTKYKMLIFSGDADTVLNFIATERWILDKLKLKVVKKWTSWTYNGGDGNQVGGWTVEFQGLTFTTVKGAGHMVPWFQPAPAFKLFADFLGKKI